MNKNQLIDALAERFEGNKKAARHALEAVLDTITREVVKGERVAITGFGAFESRVRQARMVRNPQTGERIEARETTVPKFTAGQDLKNIVSGAKKLPQLTIAAAYPVAKKTAERAVAVATPGSSSSASKSSTSKSTASKSSASKSTAKKASASKTTATKAPAKKASAKKASAAKKSTSATSTASKSTASKSTAKKTSASKTAAKKTSTAKKAPAKKTTAKKTTAKKTTAKKTAEKA